MTFYIIPSNSDLMHYGIKGQKWGVRRFQNPDGTLTAEGKARAKAEYKEDNKKAFELGKDATIKSYAAYKANKKADRKRATDVDKETAKRLSKAAAEAEKKVKQNYEELVKKYGSEAIAGLSYDKKGRLKESVASGKDYAVALGMTALSAAVGLVAMPALGSNVGFMTVFTPAGRASLGTQYYKNEKKQVKKDIRNRK